MRQRLNLTKLPMAAAMLVALALVLVLLPGGAGAQEETAPGEAAAEAEVPEPPELDARAWALVDAETGLFLAGENADERLPIASMTKIMTALVALEAVEAGETSLAEEVVISEQAESYVGFLYSNVGLILGEQTTVRDLLVAALDPSGTDAVYALAEHLGDGGSVDAFVNRMNEEAASMGLSETNFESPAGLDTPENYSNARDMAKMSQAAMEYPEFAEIVGMTDAVIRTQGREIEVFNTNDLLSTYPPATGIKTGTSPESGPSLAASAEDNEESYIAIVLDAESEDGTPGDRFEDARTILEYGFECFDREALVSRDEAYEELPMPYRRDEIVELIAAEDVLGPVDAASEVERRVTTVELPPEAQSGQRFGEVEVLIGGQSIGSSPLVAREGYEEASIWDRITYTVGGLFE